MYLLISTAEIYLAKKDSCESVLSAEFELKDKLVTPQVPTLTLTAESCTAPTKAVIDNYVSGQTYWHNGSQLTVNTTMIEIGRASCRERV